MSRSATCVWRITPDLVLALDEHLGLPVDSYVNGTQTWLTEHEQPEATLEWRLHPAAGYRKPDGISPYDVWDQVVLQLGRGDAADALTLGSMHRTLRSVWDGLECFVPYGDDLEPATLAQAATDVIGTGPDAAGLVDHDRIGAAWEQAGGAVSLVEMLLAELHT